MYHQFKDRGNNDNTSYSIIVLADAGTPGDFPFFCELKFACPVNLKRFNFKREINFCIQSTPVKPRPNGQALLDKHFEFYL